MTYNVFGGTLNLALSIGGIVTDETVLISRDPVV